MNSRELTGVELRMVQLASRTLLCVLCVLCASAASAQTDFGQIDAMVGNRVRITEASGNVTTGRLTRVSPSVVAVGDHDFSPAPGLKIDRLGDSLWNGMAIGAFVGFVYGVLYASGECGVRSNSRSLCVVAGMTYGSAVGIAIDWLHTGSVNVYMYQPPATGVAGSKRPPASLAIAVRF
jgi:hypothetical protein